MTKGTINRIVPFFVTSLSLNACSTAKNSSALYSKPIINETGSCSIICEDKPFKCVDGVPEIKCDEQNKYEIFKAIPRCPHTIKFAKGKTCEP